MVATRLLIIGVLAMLLCWTGCSESSDSSRTPDTGTQARVEAHSSASDREEVVEEPGSVEQLIEDELNDAIARLRLGDKSGLYENEFAYLLDENTFDDYLKHGQVVYAQADSIEFLDVRKVVEFPGDDSARVELAVMFRGPSGSESQIVDEISVYNHLGRWIKPTVSVRNKQDEYDSLIREAEAAVEAESR